jgi:hypothetical protein
MGIGFIEHLNTQLVTASNCNCLSGECTLKITVTAAQISLLAFTSLFLVTDLNHVFF